jgi:hypothetical protein
VLLVYKLAEIVDATIDELAEILKMKYLEDIGPEDDRRCKVARMRSKVMTQRQTPGLPVNSRHISRPRQFPGALDRDPQ